MQHLSKSALSLSHACGSTTPYQTNRRRESTMASSSPPVSARRPLYEPRPPAPLYEHSPPATARESVRTQLDRASRHRAERLEKLRCGRDRYERVREHARTARANRSEAAVSRYDEIQQQEAQLEQTRFAKLAEERFYRHRATVRNETVHLQRRELSSRRGVEVVARIFEESGIEQPPHPPHRIAAHDRYDRLLQPLEMRKEGGSSSSPPAPPSPRGLPQRMERHMVTFKAIQASRQQELEQRCQRRDEQREQVLDRLRDRLAEMYHRLYETLDKTDRGVQRAEALQKRRRNPLRALAIDRYMERHAALASRTGGRGDLSSAADRGDGDAHDDTAALGSTRGRADEEERAHGNEEAVDWS